MWLETKISHDLWLAETSVSTFYPSFIQQHLVEMMFSWPVTQPDHTFHQILLYKIQYGYHSYWLAETYWTSSQVFTALNLTKLVRSIPLTILSCVFLGLFESPMVTWMSDIFDLLCPHITYACLSVCPLACLSVCPSVTTSWQNIVNTTLPGYFKGIQ